MNCSFIVWFNFITVHENKIYHHEAVEQLNVVIKDILFSSTQTTLAFRIRVENLSTILFVYGIHGHYQWTMCQEIQQHFKNILRFLDYPTILVDVLNENDPVKLFNYKPEVWYDKDLDLIKKCT